MTPTAPPSSPEAPRSSSKSLTRHALFLTLVLEGATLIARFGLGLQSTRDTASTIGHWTGGIRIHHGYPGILAILLACTLLNRAPRCSRFLLVAGIALVASDLIHHFLVLWPLTGNPQFDLTYPAINP